MNVKSYGLVVSIPDTGTAIAASAFIRLRKTKAAPDTLRLDLVDMTVDSVCELRVQGCARLPFRYDGRSLALAGAGTGPRGIRVFYRGTPSDGLIISTNLRGRRVAFADNWPERARFWVPTVDHPSDKATVRVFVSAPKNWRIVANGKRGAVSWSESHPIPTYTMVIGAGEFAVSTHRPVINGRDTIPIEVWTYAEDSAFADSVPFRRATEIVEVMQRLIGPFPYEKLAHVQSSTKFGGMENSSAIFYAEKPYIERRMGEGVVRHETAHQWFGDAVTERDWPHLWLSEGFATYFDGVIAAALDGDSTLARHMRRARRTISLPTSPTGPSWIRDLPPIPSSS